MNRLHRIGAGFALCLALTAASIGVHAGQLSPPMQAGETVCPAYPGWDDAAYPMRIHGDTWFVGTCGISAILLTSADGHILIDGGTEQSAAQVLGSIRLLGFQPEDVRYILSSHEHLDHAGALAELQRATGAPVLASRIAAATLRTGRNSPIDPQYRSLKSFPAVAAVRGVNDGETIRLDKIEVTAVQTPGHTPGSMSWRWRSCDDAGCRDVVYADSLTAVSDPDYRFSDDSAHPGSLAAFSATLDRVDALPCEILLTPHPSASRMWKRIGADDSEPLVDAKACRAYAAAARERLDARLREEHAEPKGAAP
jgi:metallo-beta-lactamase class B